MMSICVQETALLLSFMVVVVGIIVVLMFSK